MAFYVPIPKEADGRILTSVSGQYEVETKTGIVSCVARGVFRNRGIAPCVGDFVKLSSDGVICEIFPRKNYIPRPPCANLDQIFFVTSLVEPYPNLSLLDAFIAVALYQGITPVVLFTKADLADPSKLEETYQKSGIDVQTIRYDDPETITNTAKRLSGKITMMTGNSGVGKSTLLNAIDPTLSIKTDAISRKLGRGKHTTRQVNLYACAGGYVADTPGFSAFDVVQYVQMKPEEVADCFPEFQPYLGMCRFHDCAHIAEVGCAIREALHDGKIAESRYASYVTLYQTMKDQKSWKT